MLNDSRLLLLLAMAFIAGWVVDWLLELYYWRGYRLRRERARIHTQLAAKDALVRELEVQLEDLRASIAAKAHTPMSLEADLKATREELLETQHRLEERERELESLQHLLQSREGEMAHLRQQLESLSHGLAAEMGKGPTPNQDEVSVTLGSGTSPRWELPELDVFFDEEARRTAGWLSDTVEPTLAQPMPSEGSEPDLPPEEFDEGGWQIEKPEADESSSPSEKYDQGSVGPDEGDVGDEEA